MSLLTFTSLRKRVLLLSTVLIVALGACVAAPVAPVPATGQATPGADVTAAPDGDATAQPTAPSEEPLTGAGIYKGFFPGASSPGLDATLYLNADGSLRLVNDYMNEEPPLVEVGTWDQQENTLTITLTGQEDQPYETPSTHTLRVDGDVLTAGDWIGPWYSVDALAMNAVTPAYDTETAASALDDSFMGYYKTVLSSASCCGRDVTLLLGVDNLARLTTDYLNGESPIVETGTWTANDDGTASVMLDGRADGTLYEAPVRFTFAAADGMLTAVDYDESLYGSEGVSLYVYPGLAMGFVNR